MYTEEEYVPLSALQHFVFCPRQCALIHTEREWAENAHTVLGHQEHERVDSSRGESRSGIYTARAVALVSHELGIRGISDVVEYRKTADSEYICPIEYKHGRPKQHLADAVQLCAQAFCLEEMHNCTISEGYLFYHSLKRRYPIVFDVELRNETKIAIRATREMLLNGQLPSAVRRKECSACSLYEICLPMHGIQQMADYNNRRFNALMSER